MARGLYAGGLAFAVFATGYIILSGYWPMWLVNRLEQGGKFCWEGEGIWQTKYRYGDNIAAWHYECTPEAGHVQFTSDAYCSDSDPDVSFQAPNLTTSESSLSDTFETSDITKKRHRKDSKEFNQKMCRATNQSKICVILSAVLGMLVIPGVLIAHNFLGKTRVICTYFVTACMFAATISSTIVLLVMSVSPLFSSEHSKVVSAGYPVRYDGVSCEYQFPIPLMVPTFDGPMACLFPGPSFASCLIAVFSFFFAFTCFALKCKELKSPKNAIPIQRLTSSLTEPLTGGSISSSGGRRYSSWLFWSGGSGSETPGLPSQMRFNRRYSMYGAFRRRFSQRSLVFQHFLTLLIPLLVAGATILLAVATMLGVSFEIYIYLEDVKHGEVIPKESILEGPALDVFRKVEEVYWHGMGFNKSLEGLLPMHFTQTSVEYAPITSLRMFMDAGAYSMGILSLIGAFIWPSLKSIIWLWFWWVPAGEIWRGRILTWVDALGKLSLATLYVIIMVSVCNHWYVDKYIPWPIVPIVRPFDFLRLRIETALLPGIGTLTYVISYIFSLLIGQLFVFLHRKCKDWEEELRDAMDLKWRCDGSDESTAIMSQGSEGAQYTGRNDLWDSPIVEEDETPYLSEGALVNGEEETLEFVRRDDTGAFINNTRKKAKDKEIYGKSTFKTVFNVEDTPFGMMYKSRQEYRRKRIPHPASGLGSDNSGSGQGTQVQISPSITGQVLNQQGELDSANSTPNAGMITESSRSRTLTDTLREQMDFYDRVETEALCNRVFSPVKNEYHRYTLRGKIVVWIFVLTTAGVIFTVLSYELFEIHREGLLGIMLISKEYKVSSYSILDVADAVVDAGDAAIGNKKSAYDFQYSFLFFVVFMPFLHVAGLVVAWVVPMRLPVQKRIMHTLEVLGAWSSLDMYLVVCLGIRFDVHNLLAALLGQSLLGPINEIVDKILPSVKVAYGIDMVFASGFWGLFAAIVLEKLLQQFILLQFATMISERVGLEEIRREHAIQRKLSKLGRGSGSGLSSRNQRFHNAELSTSMITSHMNLLSPAARYITASEDNDHIYAGQLRIFWKALIMMGLLKKVTHFGKEEFRYGSLNEEDEDFAAASTEAFHPSVRTGAPSDQETLDQFNLDTSDNDQ